MPTRCRLWIAALAVIGATACGGGDAPRTQSPTAPPPPPPPPAPSLFSTAVLVGAGDIAMCGAPGAEATAALIDGIEGTVFTSGDNAYFQGTASQYLQCYEPTWGRHKWRTRPTPGNHEYETAGASAYYNYFGQNAGPSGQGYYSYDLGAWHIVALNSNVPAAEGSPQMQWLRQDLASTRARCVAAIWHHPLFSSGQNGPNSTMRDMWRTLRELGADVVIAGHDHIYERFARQDENGRLSSEGIRSFVVGTGGAELTNMSGRLSANSEVRLTKVLGVLKLTLQPDRYSWQFIAVPSTQSDSGSDSCR